MSNPTLLIVDDDAFLRRALGRVLRRAKWNVVEAEDGLEALERLAEGAVALMVTDMRMPRMNGMELIEAARSRGESLPIVVLSGYHDHDRARLEANNVAAVLDKPVSPVDLRQLVTRLLAA